MRVGILYRDNFVGFLKLKLVCDILQKSNTLLIQI